MLGRAAVFLHHTAAAAVVVCAYVHCLSPAPAAATSSPSADCIPKDLLQYYQRLLASQPARRLNPKALLEAGVLRNRLADATAFLEQLAIKDALEKVCDAYLCTLLGKGGRWLGAWFLEQLAIIDMMEKVLMLT